VPSGPHPTIQSAVDDGSCTEILLAAQSFVESVLISRDLSVAGVSAETSIIEGQLEVEGGTTQVSLESMTVDASARGVAGTVEQALLVEGGAEVTCLDVVVRNAVEDPWTIFADGFESGDTSAWSNTVP
jgi:hypothetical protein